MNQVCSILSQVLQLFCRVEFEAAVRAGGKVLADEVISFYGLPSEGRENFFLRVEIWGAEHERRG